MTQSREERIKALRAVLQKKWVVRSMSTTDFRPARGPNHPGQIPEPFHIYLLPSMERSGAYWADRSRAQLFDSPQEAEAEANRCLPADSAVRVNIAPALDDDMPTYWELDKLRFQRKQAARS
jgi:hypothetical protein